jgi:ABC-type glycerol-3-phosphate transport system substrate-binding protein
METSTFQKIVLALCFLLAVGAVVVFATMRAGVGSSNEPVTMWGPIPPSSISRVLDVLNQGERIIELSYEEVPEEEMVDTLIEALASGRGPDIAMISSEQIVELADKIARIPYETLSEREFKDAFVEQGELFMDKDGIIAIPFMVDPLVTYWNRDLFDAASISRPPEYWDELPGMISKLVKTDGTRTLYQSAVALGEYQNVAHAKEILSAMIIQAGNPIVARDVTGEGELKYISVLTERYGRALVPADAALDFYVQFADPSRDTYTWNRALKNSTDSFIAGELAMYFGFASELRTLRAKNPNLNYDVAPFVQARDGQGKKTFGKMYALAITNSTSVPDSAYQAILNLVSTPAQTELLAEDVLPPIRRDMLVTAPGNAYGPVFYSSALAARGFLDPGTAETEAIFKEAIESVISGRARTGESLGRANGQLELLLSR